MAFSLTAVQLMIQQAGTASARIELFLGVLERDHAPTYPDVVVRKKGLLVSLGNLVVVTYRRSGKESGTYVLAMEELSKVDASASVMVSVNHSLVCWGLETYGTEEQKQKYLTRLASGEVLGAFCLSEPEAGSDATSQKTTAVDQ